MTVLTRCQCCQRRQTFEKWRKNPRGEVLSGWSPEQSPGEFSTFYCHKVLTIRRISGQRPQHRVNGDINGDTSLTLDGRRRHSSYDQSGVSKFAYGCRNSNHNRKKTTNVIREPQITVRTRPRFGLASISKLKTRICQHQTTENHDSRTLEMS